VSPLKLRLREEQEIKKQDVEWQTQVLPLPYHVFAELPENVFFLLYKNIRVQ